MYVTHCTRRHGTVALNRTMHKHIPVQYTNTFTCSTTHIVHSFIHSSVAHKHARNGHALCDTKLNTLVARSRHFSQVVSPASPSSSLHVHRRGASRGYLVTHGCRFRFYSVPGGRVALVVFVVVLWYCFLSLVHSALDLTPRLRTGRLWMLALGL